jgi:hypothetical protein
MHRAKSENLSEEVGIRCSKHQEAKLKDKEITPEKRCSFPIPDIDLDAGTAVHSVLTSFISRNERFSQSQP